MIIIKPVGEILSLGLDAVQYSRDTTFAPLREHHQLEPLRRKVQEIKQVRPILEVDLLVSRRPYRGEDDAALGHDGGLVESFNGLERQADEHIFQAEDKRGLIYPLPTIVVLKY
jgi:hypothetical protein